LCFQFTPKDGGTKKRCTIQENNLPLLPSPTLPCIDFINVKSNSVNSVLERKVTIRNIILPI
jgi:hypothetical protein